MTIQKLPSTGRESVQATDAAALLEQAQALSKILDEQNYVISRLYDRGYKGGQNYRGLSALTPEQEDFAGVATVISGETQKAFRRRMIALAEEPGSYADVLEVIAADRERAGGWERLHSDIRSVAEKERLKHIAPEVTV